MPVGPGHSSYPSAKTSKLKSESSFPMTKGGGNKMHTFTSPKKSRPESTDRFIPKGHGKKM